MAIMNPFVNRKIKGSLVVKDRQKKFDLERSLEVGQISQRQLFRKNLTFIFADLLNVLTVNVCHKNIIEALLGGVYAPCSL